jgi:UDP-N-acetylmuramoyl-L-alanyl-D-glutamate--2,6-diaminopimelate ligase
VLNADDAHGARWAADLRSIGHAVSTYGLAAGAGVRAEAVETDRSGSRFVVDGRAFSLGLVGRFNVHNALAAIAAARALGIGDDVSSAALARIEPVRGRMQRVGGEGFDVYVDYAHTPDALERVLREAKALARGRVILVFGCGGDRDAGKRAEMGAVAASLADAAILTNDNPRTESPAAIAADVLAGTAGAPHVRTLLDRRAAIEAAVEEAAAGDVVVVAGKGHETYQVTGDEVMPFDDAAEVRRALRLPEPAA